MGTPSNKPQVREFDNPFQYGPFIADHGFNGLSYKAFLCIFLKQQVIYNKWLGHSPLSLWFHRHEIP